MVILIVLLPQCFDGPKGSVFSCDSASRMYGFKLERKYAREDFKSGYSICSSSNQSLNHANDSNCNENNRIADFMFTKKAKKR